MTKKLNVFEEVANKIEDKIKRGMYISSQRLPSEYDLANEFSTSRLTIRKAIDDLISRNILFKQKGNGTYVMAQPKIQSGVSGLQSFTEAAKNYGKQTSTKVIKLEKAFRPDGNIAEILELDTDETVFHIVRLRYYDNVPMTVEELYIREAYLPKILDKSAVQDSIFQLIEKKIAIAYSHQEVEAFLVDERLSNYLEVSVGSPSLMIHSTVFSVTAMPILYDISYYRGDKYSLKNTLHRYNN
jgi:GntR family transcriptional regulator